MPTPRCPRHNSGGAASEERRTQTLVLPSRSCERLPLRPRRSARRSAGISYCYPPRSWGVGWGSGLGTAPEGREGGKAHGASSGKAPQPSPIACTYLPRCPPVGVFWGPKPSPHARRGTTPSCLRNPLPRASPISRWTPDSNSHHVLPEGFPAPSRALVTGSDRGDWATADGSSSRTRAGTETPQKRSDAKGVNLSSALAAK